MKTTDDQLQHLMRQATETLEPRRPDLVERGMQRGVVRRRRRRVLSVVAGAAAVAMTVTGVALVQAQLGPQADQLPVAGPSTPKPKPKPKPDPEAEAWATPAPPPPASPAETLTTLKGLVPGLPTSGGKTWGDDFIGAGLFVVDDLGKAWLEMGIETVKYDPNCADVPSTQNCKVQPDGTFLRTYSSSDRGIHYNAVVLEYPDRRAISLTSTNGLGLEGPATRAEPPLSIAQLVEMAYSNSWSFPAANYGKNLNR
ncbi:hypothetical protein OG474_22270 [Kribbella sp. NBC_01505]|uniref:hypothetical protein n=1 Tax=Kribbella sp. NBC_01505 TaxID=2903580 RepID=UPI00386BE1A1